MAPAAEDDAVEAAAAAPLGRAETLALAEPWAAAVLGAMAREGSEERKRKRQVNCRSVQKWLQ